MSNDSPTAEELAAMLRPVRQVNSDKQCGFPACTRRQRTRGLCNAHYLRVLRATKRLASGSSS